MTHTESATSNDAFATAMIEARLLLTALAFAVCALGFAAAAILAPPVQLTPIAALRASS
jgi:hypothetical protein